MAYASCARSSAVSVTSCRPAARRRAARSADMPLAGPGPGTALMVAPSQLEARVAEGWTLVDIRDERQHANARLKAAAHVPLFVADESQGASVLGRKVRQRGWVGGLRTHARVRAHARPPADRRHRSAVGRVYAVNPRRSHRWGVRRGFVAARARKAPAAPLLQILREVQFAQAQAMAPRRWRCATRGFPLLQS